jgi:hypothetical protein
MLTRFSLAGVACWLSIMVGLNQTWAAPAGGGRGAPPAMPRDSAEARQYNALVDEAASEFDARRYEEARALYKRAHEISPNARTLRGIGMSSFELREYVEALRALEASLVNKRKPLTSTQRQEVQGMVDRSRSAVGRFIVTLSPKDAQLKVDGAAAVLEEDGSLLLSFGRHLLTAEAPGKAPANREVNVIGGERQEVAFALGPLGAKVSGIRRGGSGALPLAPRRDDNQADESRRGVGPALWFSGAGVLAGVAIAGVVWWRYQVGQTASCDRAASQAGICFNRGVLIGREHLALGTLIGGAAGALALSTVGAVVLAKRGKKETGAAFACLPAFGSVSCEVNLTF